MWEELMLKVIHLPYIPYCQSKAAHLHNKPKAEVHPGHKLMGPKEEEGCT
jgi:hypothetical protein